MSVLAMAWAFAQDLPGPEKLVLLALADRADDDGLCWPGLERLASKCSMARRTVRHHILKLKRSGLVKVDPQFRKDGSQRSNLYRLSLEGRHERASPPATERLPPRQQSAPLDPSCDPSEKKKKNGNRNDSEESTVPDAAELIAAFRAEQQRRSGSRDVSAFASQPSRKEGAKK